MGIIDAKNLPKRYKPSEFEEKWRKVWAESAVYSWDPKRPRDETFVVDTPPPTVSGSLHVGHIFSYTQTDLTVRYQRMKGLNIFYPMGWDDNGLPTERRVQNVYGIQCDLDKPYDPDWKPQKVRSKDKGKKAQNISRRNFTQACALLTQEDELVFKQLYEKIGLSVDWSLEYATIDDHCRKVSQLSFLDLVEKDEVYSLEAPSQWDVDFQTAVAQAELEDREREGFYHHITFKIADAAPDGPQDFVISTTRPELLAACIAVVAHPDDERYKHLFGKEAITPIFKAKVPIKASEHADPEKGSGILMICTFGDNADVDWWKQNRLPTKQIIGRNGCLLPVEFGQAPFESLDPKTADEIYNSTLAGKSVKQAQKQMVELLKDPSHGFDNKAALNGDPERTVRPVKFYEKGERPIEILTTRQWFIKILKHKDLLLNQGEKIKWHPDHMKVRYNHWVEGLNQDWCISRQRYFGVPFPVWYPLDDQGEPLYDQAIFARAEHLPVDPSTDCPPGFEESQRNQKGGFIGDNDVMDTWATSSMTPQISSWWGIEEGRHNSLFPADIRPQSHEIIRTWAFYTIVKATLHEGKIPWHHIAISGWILDPDRKKMSKSVGNVVTPEQFIDDYSADAVRYWTARARLGVDTAFDQKVFNIGKKLANKIFNASKFILSQLDGLERSAIDDLKAIQNPLDKVWLNKMMTLVEDATKAQEALDYATALQQSEDTFWMFCDHYLELVKSRAYKGEGADKTSALICLNYSLNTFLRLFAPILPFITEEIWSWIYKTEDQPSIHAQGMWPKCTDLKENLGPEFFGKAHDEALPLAIDIISKIRSAKTENQKNLRWPVQSLTLHLNQQQSSYVEGVLPDLIRTGNIDPNGVKIEQIEGEDLKVEAILADSED